ncbi:O-antigen ligase family protein [Paenibacillus sp. UMB4589-SE434]|uniref:O-antigen ligase family protein n=1 Tax=Paenibacillus sp. UMB4589-SE434 TaxID=3046314 RepID=UPI00254AFAD1|nr:O-antigen ligase family protein [Paenibacillus sp. UMB4589-SE434]MDK8181670.1 O-antigen ligase family protein [Paenibacillus sp. UMB4589-SE434]
MSEYGYSKSTTKEKRLAWDKIPFFALILFFIWAPYQVALFNGQSSNFEPPIYLSMLFASIISFLFFPSFYKETKEINTKTIIILGAFLLPITYCISMFGAASSFMATNLTLIMCVYFIFFAITSTYLNKDSNNNSIQSLIIISSYGIVAFGLLHWLNSVKWIQVSLGWLIPFDANGLFKDAVMMTVDGARLTSVFQYANTYAAFLMAFLFAAVFYVGKSRKWWSRATHAFMMVPIMLSIFLTLSRGGLLLLPVVFIILLVFLKPHRQLMWIFHLVISGIVTVGILNPVTDIGLNVQQAFSTTESMKGWAYVAVGSLISAVLSLALEKWVAPWLESKMSHLSNKKWGTFLFPIGGALLGASLLFIFMGTDAKNILPENIQTRLGNINLVQHSVLERFTFYKDSMKVIADHPVIGAGGGGWGALYEQYQNNPYTSRQAHNFFLQYLIETGILGFVIFMTFLVYLFYQFIRSYIRAHEHKRESYFLYFIIALSILVHSILDFNMSYVFMGILVFIGLGGMSAAIDSKPFTKLSWNPTKVRSIYITALGLVSVVLLITAITFVSASNSFNQSVAAAGSSNDYTQITTPLDKALGIQGHHPNYVGMKADLLSQIYKQTQKEEFFTAADSLLKDTLKSESSNKQLWMQLNKLYSYKNMNKEIYDVYDNNKYRYPWDIEWYEQFMHISSLLGSNSDDKALKDKYLNSVFDSLKHIQLGIEHLKTLPEGQLQGRKFEVTPKVALHAGQAYYLTGKTQEAYDMMKAHLQEDLTPDPAKPNDTSKVDLLRWYLAMTKKLGLRDDANLAKLLALDPEEQAKIDSIVNMQIQ